MQCQLYPIFQGVCYVVPDPFDMRDVVDRNTPHSGAMVMSKEYSHQLSVNLTPGSSTFKLRIFMWPIWRGD